MAAQEPNHLQMAQSPLGLQHLQAHQQAQHPTPSHAVHAVQQMQAQQLQPQQLQPQHNHGMAGLSNQHSTPQAQPPQQSPAGGLPNNSISPAQAMTSPPPGTRFSHALLEDLRAEQAQFVADRDMDRLQSPRNLLFALVSSLEGLQASKKPMLLPLGQGPQPHQAVPRSVFKACLLRVTDVGNGT